MGRDGDVSGQPQQREEEEDELEDHLLNSLRRRQSMVKNSVLDKALTRRQQMVKKEHLEQKEGAIGYFEERIDCDRY